MASMPSPSFGTTPTSSSNNFSERINIRFGNVVIAEQSGEINIRVFDLRSREILKGTATNLCPGVRTALLDAVAVFTKNAGGVVGPAETLPRGLIQELFLILSRKSTLEVRSNEPSFNSNTAISSLGAFYANTISQSAIAHAQANLRVVALGNATSSAIALELDLRGNIHGQLSNYSSTDRPLWVDLNLSGLADQSEALLKLSTAFEIDITNLLATTESDPSRVSRLRSDGWWHFCSVVLARGDASLEGRPDDEGKGLITPKILHSFIKGRYLITVHSGDLEPINRVMADMLTGGLLSSVWVEPSKGPEPVGEGHVLSLILASSAHRANDLIRKVIEDASKKLEGCEQIGAKAQQVLATKISHALNLVDQFRISFKNDNSEMLSAANTEKHRFSRSYLERNSALISDIDSWISIVRDKVDNFYRVWTTAMDLVQNKAQVILTRLLGALGVPAAITSLADVDLTSLKGGIVGGLSAVLALYLISLRPTLHGKRIQLG